MIFKKNCSFFIICVCLLFPGSDFIYDLFETVVESQKSGGGKDKRKRVTVSAQFKVSSWIIYTPLEKSNANTTLIDYIYFILDLFHPGLLHIPGKPVYLPFD